MSRNDRPSSRRGEEEIARLFQEYRRTRDPRVRSRLILAHEPLVRFLATRFAGCDEPLEDQVQVGWIGLINAVDRFDPDHGTQFVTYAIPTIVGTIPHHVRDRVRRLKVPRSLLELRTKANRANEFLSQELARKPSVAEIAAHLGVSEEEVLQAMEAASASETVSPESRIPIGDDESSFTIEELVGGVDRHLENLETAREVKQAVRDLEHRERQIVYLRFFQGLTQREVGKRLRLSQMHISRLQRRALNQLRKSLLERQEESARGAPGASPQGAALNGDR